MNSIKINMYERVKESSLFRYIDQRKAFTLIELAVVIVIIGIVILLLLPLRSGSREPSRCIECIKRMQAIGVALRQYHDEYKAFPPVCTVDHEGQVLHSWRTLILPYLLTEEEKLKFKGIRLDEPWNSEWNKLYHDKMPRPFQCPSCFPDMPQTTIYKMIVGENTASGRSLSSFKKEPAEIIQLTEIWPPVLWMSPEDFPITDFDNAIYRTGLTINEPADKYRLISGRNPDNKPVIGGEHIKEFHILFADGAVKTYKDWTIPISDLKKMCLVE